MRTTLNIDDDLLQRARELWGMQEKTASIREGLKALIERESARRLARLEASAGAHPSATPRDRRVILVDTSI